MMIDSLKKEQINEGCLLKMMFSLFVFGLFLAIRFVFGLDSLKLHLLPSGVLSWISLFCLFDVNSH